MASPKFLVYGLDETYPELGEYSCKIVLSPRFSNSGSDFDVRLIDSDRKPLRFELKRWGRKLNVTFYIDRNAADGVATIIIVRGIQEVGRLGFWIIKP